jgi:hypothetical protein
VIGGREQDRGGRRHAVQRRRRAQAGRGRGREPLDRPGLDEGAQPCVLLERLAAWPAQDARADLARRPEGVEDATHHRPATHQRQRLAGHAGGPGDRIVRGAVTRQDQRREGHPSAFS